MSDNPTTAQEVYVVIGTEGEYSDRQVWVAGVFDTKSEAVAMADDHKRTDRDDYIKWRKWVAEFGAKLNASNEKYTIKQRAAIAARLGMPPEPPTGAIDADYTVATVPMNAWGRWDYA